MSPGVRARPLALSSSPLVSTVPSVVPSAWGALSGPQARASVLLLLFFPDPKFQAEGVASLLDSQGSSGALWKLGSVSGEAMASMAYLLGLGSLAVLLPGVVQ